jgi:hypothetical protein
MIERLRAAWAALRGGLVLSGHGWVAVYKTPQGGEAVRWDGLTPGDAARMLYRAADATVDATNQPTVH